MHRLHDLLQYYGLCSRSVVLFLLASILVQGTLAAINVILNLYILQLGFSEDFAGMLMSVKLLTSGLLCIPAGIFCVRRGLRQCLLFATMALGGGVLLTIVTSPFSLVAGAMLMGAAQAGKAVSVAPFLVEHSNPRIRQNLFSLNFALMMLSNMAGNALSGYLPQLWPRLLTGYSGTLQVFGILALLALVPLGWIAASRGSNKLTIWNQLGGGLRLVRDNLTLARLLFCHALIGFGAGLIVPLFNVFLSGKLGASSGEIGLIMSLAQVATAVGALLVPLLVLRRGKVATISGLRLLSIPFLVLIAIFTNLHAVALVFFMRSALMNMTHPVESNFAMELVPGDSRAVWSSMLKMMDTLTRGVSVLLGGWMMTVFSYNVPYYFTCGLYAFTCILFWFWFRKIETGPDARVA